MNASTIISQIPFYLALLGAVLALFLAQRSAIWPGLNRFLTRIACRRRLAVALVGAVAAAHYVLLALYHPPLPVFADEFSYLLMAETFTDGRLTNPPPPLSYLLWAPEVIFSPTYQSKYPPAQGLFLALGWVLGGHPLVGVWISMAAACAATCWMMQAWVRPRWAFLGGLMVATHKALAAYWGATYFGGAAAMLGGALLFGSLPRLLETRRARYAVTLGLGLALLANSRPFEGLVASLPAAAVILVWLIKQRAWSSAMLLRRVVAPLLVVLAITGLAMGTYHEAVTGSPLRMPYQVFLETSQVANVALPGDPQARTADEPPALIERHFMFYTLGGDPHLWLPLLLLPWVVRRHRWMQLGLVTTVLTFTAVWFTVLASAHYGAPVTALLFTLYMQSVRFLRAVLRHRRAIFQLFVAVFLVLWLQQLIDSPGFHASRIPPEHNQHYALLRAELMKPLEADADRHLIVVPWDNRTSRVLTWVNNPPDIDAAKIVWAWQGVGLAEHFVDRKYWLLDESVWPPVLVEATRSEILWVLRTRDDAEATLVHRPGTGEGVRVDIGRPGPDEMSIILARGHPPLRRGAGYELRFRARADQERPLRIHIGHADGSWSEDAGLHHEVDLGTEWRDYTLEYVSGSDIAHSGVSFAIGSSSAAVEIADLEIRERVPPPGEPGA